MTGWVYSPSMKRKSLREPGVVVSVPSAPAVQNVQLHMVPAGVITGRVLDSDGRPTKSRPLGLVHYLYDENGKKILAPVPGVHYPKTSSSFLETDDRGEYRFYGLPSGDYCVVLLTSSGNYYYPGVVNEASAEVIHVQAGDEIRLRTLTPPSSKPVQVRFHIVGADGGPSSADFKSDGFSLSGSSDAGGSVFLTSISPFSIPGRTPASASERILPLVPGSYEFVAGLFSKTEAFYGRTRLNVGDMDMDQELRMVRGVRVTGNISVEDDTGHHMDVVGPGPWCRLYSDALHIATTGASTQTGCLGAEYSPGLYRLEFKDMPPNAYVVSAKADDHDVLESGVQLTGNIQLRIVLNTSGSVIEGVVSDSNGQKLSEAVVALVPDAPLRLAGPLYRSAISEIDGRYEIRGVAPGSYHLYAWPDLEGAAYRNAEFMKAFDDRGVPVQVKKGEPVALNLTAF